MVKCFVFMLVALLALSSPVSAQERVEFSVQLIGVGSNADEFVSFLEISPDSQEDNIHVVWSEAGELLYSTQPGGYILETHPALSKILVVEEQGLFLVDYSTGWRNQLLGAPDSAQFDAVMTAEEIIILASQRTENGWQSYLVFYDQVGTKTRAEAAIDGRFQFINGIDQSGAVLVGDSYSNPVEQALYTREGEELDLEFFRPVNSIDLERELELQGQTVEVTGCDLDLAGICISGTEFQYTTPRVVTQEVRIAEAFPVPGTEFTVGLGSSSFTGQQWSLLFVENPDQDWEVFWHGGIVPSRELWPWGGLRSFAIIDGQVLSVWDWPDGQHFLGVTSLTTMTVERDLTESLIPTPEQLGLVG